jgi:hypothetical protein
MELTGLHFYVMREGNFNLAWIGSLFGHSSLSGIIPRGFEAESGFKMNSGGRE